MRKYKEELAIDQSRLCSAATVPITTLRRRVMFAIIGLLSQDSLYATARGAKAYSLSRGFTVDDVVTDGRRELYLTIGLLFQDSPFGSAWGGSV